MWILIMILSITGFLRFTMGVSLLERKANIFLINILIAFIPILHHQFALQTNINVLIKKLSNLEFISGLATLEIAVIVFTTFFSIALIHSHFNNSKTRIKKFFSLFPYVIFIVGIMLLQLWIFNEITGVSYLWLSIGLSVTLFMVLTTFVFLFKIGLKDWTLRLELKTLLSVLQIVGAMMLPVFFQQVTMISLNKSQINFIETLLIIGAILIVSLLGFINYKFKISEKIWKYYIKY